MLVSWLFVEFWVSFAEFDAITGCRISAIDIGAPVVRMSYSPTSAHAVIAILEVVVVSFCIALGSNSFGSQLSLE